RPCLLLPTAASMSARVNELFNRSVLSAGRCDPRGGFLPRAEYQAQLGAHLVLSIGPGTDSEGPAMPIECDFRIFVDRPRGTISLRLGEFLFREGDAADALYIVSHGTLQQIMSGIAVYEVVNAGGIVGEMAIVEEDKPRSASAISNTLVELIKIDRPAFREMV